MRIVQILGGVVHWDTQAKRIEDLPPFAPDILIVEAPDNVREGWGYIETEPGSGVFEFVMPTPPEGWIYDEATGTFYPEGGTLPTAQPTVEELLAMIAERDEALAVFGIPEEEATP